jgi:NAD(P)-dependent dehydrogenase (short-subunit alcohol dehydrogenase family)
MTDMSGRVALVTGAASGIGLATAEALARAGAAVALVSRPNDDLEGARARCQAVGAARVITIGADVGDSTAVEDAFAQAVAELGPIDAVHNNAGISIVAALDETTDEMWHALTSTNLDGNFYVLREAARVMKPRGRGAIVNTASELALIGQAGYVAYTATKGGILAMTRSAAAELASWGIRVNAVCPGTTRTPMFLREFDGAADPAAEYADNEASVALGRVADPSEISDAVLFLLSDASTYVTGTHLVVDGGRTACVPAGSIGIKS